MWKEILLVMISVSVAACASNPPPVPIEGDRGSLVLLAGEWAGSYVGHESGRSGSIIFSLQAHADSAYGDVLMIPRPSLLDPHRTDNEALGATRQPHAAEPIGIRFVRAEANSVSGQLADYRDPECGCRLKTTFRGDLIGDRIEGTFHTQHLEGGERHTGTWHVRRRQP